MVVSDRYDAVRTGHLAAPVQHLHHQSVVLLCNVCMYVFVCLPFILSAVPAVWEAHQPKFEAQIIGESLAGTAVLLLL